MMLNSYNLMKQLFTDPEATSQQLQQKQTALMSLHQVFNLIDDSNIQRFIRYLQEWITYQIDPIYMRLLVQKIKQILDYFTNQGKPRYCQKLFTLLFALMQCQDTQTRRRSTYLCTEMLRNPYGYSFLKKIVKNLLNNQSLYFGYQSALSIFANFHERYDKIEDLNQIFHNENLYRSYHSRKITVNSIINFCSLELPSHLIEILYTILNKYLIGDTEELIQANALKAKILILQKGVQIRLVNSQNVFNQIKIHYDSELVRIKYILLEGTPILVKIYQPNDIKVHADFIYRLMNPEEPEISDIAIDNLKYLFKYLDQNIRRKFLTQILEISKDDHKLQETVASNLLQLLVEQPQNVVTQYINDFLTNITKDIKEKEKEKEKEKKDMNKDKERVDVKASLLNNFFKYPNSKQLYSVYKDIFAEILNNKNWRIRQQSIGIIDNMIGQFPIDTYFIDTLKKLIFDGVYRIRQKAIDLISRNLDNYYQLVVELIPKVLEEYTNVNYLSRLTVLAFIEKTIKRNNLPPNIKIAYAKTIQVLSLDRIMNVKQKALQLKKFIV